jgi:hypothetical protein
MIGNPRLLFLLTFLKLTITLGPVPYPVVPSTYSILISGFPLVAIPLAVPPAD